MDMLDIRDFGAVGDGRTLNTRAIQQAIDRCSQSGAAGVLIAGGRYVTGTIHLKDNVRLHVRQGAELLGSTRIEDYATGTHKNMYRDEPHMDRCLIFAAGARNIAIEGRGAIDGQGFTEHFPNRPRRKFERPMLIRLLECSHVRMRDLTLKNPAAWTSAWLYCSDIVVEGVTIHSRSNSNGDGLDFDGCRDVRVTNCSFDTSDDSICLQASRPDRPCRDVMIANCTFCSKWAGLRIGLLSRGDIMNVAVSNCAFRDINDAGLKIQLCEGGEMKNLAFANLAMENVPRPILLTFCQQRACVDAPPGLAPMKAMRNLSFTGMVIDSGGCGKDSAIIMVGMPGHRVQDVLLSDILMTTGGGGQPEDAADEILPDLEVERLEGAWPEYQYFGRTVPAYGIYAGHVEGLTVRNVRLKTAQADARPAIICHDAPNLAISGIVAQQPPAGQAIRLHDCVLADEAGP